MYNVSEAYKLAIDADTREIRAKLEVYFDEVPTVYVDTDITSMDILIESQTEGDSPLGSTSSNELTVGLDNSNRMFTLTNTLSPLYGKIIQGLKVKSYYQCVLPAGVEDIPMGTYYITDWLAPSDSLQATITGQDRLFFMYKEDIPNVPMKLNTTMKEYIESLFIALGLASNEYVVDEALDWPVHAAWLPKGKMKSAFEYISKAAACSIFCDRLDRIIVKRATVKALADRTLSENSQIRTASDPYTFVTAYDTTAVKYYIPSVKNLITLLDAQEVTLNPGINTLTDIAFASPVAVIQQVRVRNGEGIVIDNIDSGVWSCNVSLNNPKEEVQIVQLTITGYAMDLIETRLNKTSQEYLVENQLIQTKEVATEYKAYLDQLISLKEAYRNVTFRGDPAIDLLDTVLLQSPTIKVSDAVCVPIRLNYTYNGALKCTGLFLKAPLAG